MNIIFLAMMLKTLRDIRALWKWWVKFYPDPDQKNPLDILILYVNPDVNPDIIRDINLDIIQGINPDNLIIILDIIPGIIQGIIPDISPETNLKSKHTRKKDIGRNDQNKMNMKLFTCNNRFFVHILYKNNLPFQN